MISNLLSSKGFIVTNKTIAKGVGLYESVILAELCNEYQYHFDNGKLTDDGYFYCTANTLENETTLSVKEQAKPLKHLEQIGFIKSKLKGVPAKRHFKIDEDCEFYILQFIQKGKTEFVPKGKTSKAKKAKHVTPKEPTNKNIDNNINKNITSSSANSTSDPDIIDDGVVHAEPSTSNVETSKEIKEAAAKLKKSEKVSNESEDERNKIDKMFEFFNKKVGSNYKPKTESNRKLILKLIRAGYTGKDFAVVISNRIKEWATDEKMKQYLTPATIFIESNFEKYLNLATQAIPKQEPTPQAENEKLINALNRMSPRDLNDEQLLILSKSGNVRATDEMNLRKRTEKWSLSK